jgi:SAM-dependent methyltransferase
VFRLTFDWKTLFLLSWRVGAGGLRRRVKGPARREAVARLACPLDPMRYIEMPQVLNRLGARPGERVLDLASPKLCSVALARAGVDVTVIDAYQREIDTWRALAGHVDGVRFELGDGRALPFPDASFDHAFSISVIEHIPDDGDFQALAELARIVKPGGRIVITMPYAESNYHEVWQERKLYSNDASAESDGDGGRHFFYRWNDRARLERLLGSVSDTEVTQVDVARLRPRWAQEAYERFFPWLVLLGPLYGFVLRERTGGDGDVVRVTLTKR